MVTAARRARDEQWVMELTAIPTAAGREQRVIEWVREWTKRRQGPQSPKHRRLGTPLRLTEDATGNLFITQSPARARRGGAAGRAQTRPLFITAHLDHPAFVVKSVDGDGRVALEFRGGVHTPYFEHAAIEIFDARGDAHRAEIIEIDAEAKPFKIVKARFAAPQAVKLVAGDVGRWIFDGENAETLPRIEKGLLYTHACDDLAAVAAALAALDVIRTRKGYEHVGVLLTRAEEIGFIGAIAACKGKSVPKNARLICLENSRSFAESPIGAGPIVRVGDKMSVFGPTLTNRIALLMTEHQKQHPEFKWQRKLMPGGTCEATTFSTYGYESTCLCLPLGNYHNMVDIDGVQAGARRPAKVGPEFISIDDYHGLIEMLLVCADQLDSADIPSLRERMEALFREHGHILNIRHQASGIRH